MSKFSKEYKISRLGIIGKHVEKYRVMMCIVLGIFSLLVLGLIIYWFFDENDINNLVDYTYLYSQIAIGLISLGMIAILLLNKYGKIKTIQLAVICHIYAVVLMGWSATMCIIDLAIGLSPIIYLIIGTVVSSLFVLEPFFFSALSLITFTSIISFHIVRHYNYFSGDFGLENIIFFVIYSILIIVIAFRHYNVTIREYQALTKVEKLTYYDELTSLLNERSYINKTEEINNNIANGLTKPFIVVLMDVNNLKATNDQYGHRYGCHLVVRTGHTLPEVFKTSTLFHVGGDEFLAVVEGEDYEDFDNVIEQFDKTFRYSLIQYEGQELIFSVARGYSKYQQGDKFADVLQRADDMMYQNKVEIKETYHLKSR